MTIKAEDIVDEKTLLAWLETRSAADAQVLAMRVSTRVSPLLLELFDRVKIGQDLYKLILLNFAVNFTTMKRCWLDETSTMVDGLTTNYLAEQLSDASLQVQHFYSGGIIGAAHSSVYSNDPPLTKEFAVRAVSITIQAISGAISLVPAEIWNSVRADASYLEDNLTLSSVPLWINRARGVRSKVILSPHIRDRLNNARKRPEFSADGYRGKWGLLLDWYESLLQDPVKSIFGEKKDIELATQKDEFWQGDPDEVMERVAALVGWPGDVTENGDLEQRPAPHSFELRNGQIHATPVSAKPINSDAAEDMRSEIVDKANELHERLTRTQAPQRVLNTVDRLLASLGDNISDVKPGIFLSRSRSLEADLLQFQTEQARDEMATDALSMMVDLGACVDDLKGMLPSVADIEAHRIALKLADGAANEALNFALEIIDIAEESEIVAASSIEALRSNNFDIEEVSAVIENSDDAMVVAEATKIRSKLIANKLQDVRNFSVSALSSVGGKASRFAKDGGIAARRGAIKGIEIGVEKAVSATIIASAAILVGGIAGQVAGLGVIVASFSPLGKRAKEVTGKDDDDLTNV